MFGPSWFRVACLAPRGKGTLQPSCPRTHESRGGSLLWLRRQGCPPPSPRVCCNSCPMRWWCYLTTSSSVASFSSCPQSFPESRTFPKSRLFTSGGQSTGASASTSVLPMNIQGWFPLGWSGLISLLFRRLSVVFSSTTTQKHQLFSAQSLWSNSHICTQLLEKP